jgi:hypothetical protein
MKRKFYCYLLTILPLFTFSQKNNLSYSILTLSDSLKQNANAVVRLDETIVTIKNQRKMVSQQKLIITFLNKESYDDDLFMAYYDKKTSINEMRATIYDAMGSEIKKIKKSDFRDFAAVDGISVFNDNRLKIIDYTPINYPFTMVYESEIETSNTAFLRPWVPIQRFYFSVEHSKMTINYPDQLGFKHKTYNFENYPQIVKQDLPNQLTFEVKNLKSVKSEPQSLAFIKIYPMVRFALENFHLEGVDGSASNWKEFGKWMNEKLIADTIELTAETKQKVKNLVGNETDPIKKARIIYKYLQDKSRYVSIQVGIGGWKPMLVDDVDRLSYGDCKALSNYTWALLKAVDVEAYYTIIQAGDELSSFDKDFTAMYGNHAILCIPHQKDYIFLECTSQTSPFGFVAGFTDNRYALIVKPEGGEIVKTTHYPALGNLQKTQAVVVIDDQGHLKAEVNIVSTGTQYGNREGRLDQKTQDDKEKYYKSYWKNISSLKLTKVDVNNDKNLIVYNENINFTAQEYGKFIGKNLIIVPNVLTQQAPTAKKMRDRKTPFEIERGFIDEDEVTIKIPVGYQIESLPTDAIFTSKYGTYEAKIVKADAQTLVYKRKLILEEGQYTASEYDAYRQFVEKIERQDNSKILLIK